MPRRKKKWMLLRGKFGNFIVVSRDWYARGEAVTRCGLLLLRATTTGPCKRWPR